MNAARALGLTAFALGAAAPFAGSPHRAATGSLDVAELAALVAREKDHVDALDLARWIRERRPGLRVVDLRPLADYERYRIPGAIHLDITGIDGHPFSADETIVLVSEGGAHAAQAWVFLRAMGLRDVFFLRGGLYDWLEEVINPILPADASPEARAGFAKTAELSRYFGGTPRIAEPGEHVGNWSVPSGKDVADAIERTRRRGC